MPVPERLTYLLSGVTAFALLAACSGGTGMPGSQQLSSHGMTYGTGVLLSHRGAIPPSKLQPNRTAAAPVKAFVSPEVKAAGAKRFFSDYVRDAVYIYRHDHRIGALKGFANPSGLATDAAGDLYVANEGAANILEYAPPYTGAPTTLNDPGQFPADVAVDSHGNVAACSLGSPYSGAGGVSFYPPGSTDPTNTLSSTVLREVYFCAFDANGNLYLDGLDPTYSFFIAGEIVGGISGTAITTLTTSNAVLYPGGVQVTASGQIAFMDQGPGPAIYTYNPPVSGSLGSPVATTPLGNASDPVSFAFDKENTDVFIADAGLVSATTYAYPAGGSPVRSHKLPDRGLPIGVAITPTEQF